MRRIATIGLIAMSITPALASTDEAWEEFRTKVAESCVALVPEPGEAEAEVNPFGTEHYGVAIVTVTIDGAEEHSICVYEKATGKAELSGPFPVRLE